MCVPVYQVTTASQPDVFDSADCRPILARLRRTASPAREGSELGPARHRLMGEPGTGPLPCCVDSSREVRAS
jgi:hypothetical protein